MSFNYDTITTNLGKNTAAAQENVNKAANLDFSDPQNLIKFQKAMGEYTQSLELQSNVMKRLGDALSGIIQKI